MSENNSYQVLARKYRPNNFDELVGQEALVSTLSNAIKQDKIHHAFILTGIRGVGKTTTARIIAKAINCQEKEGVNPCNQCTNCLSINNSQHQDVIEVDAASRTGVNDMREIIDNIAYKPVNSTYKVYIIDEVHMLSNSAFNAMLKTLEEPPAHVKFIFATTEIRKVPVTILSRCQRFDLRRLGNEELVSHLSNILQKENYEPDDKILALIAKAADGSVRDSLSLLDQAISYNNYEPSLKIEAVENMLGLNDQNLVCELFKSIIQGQVKQAVEQFDKFYETSPNVILLFKDLLEVCHKAIMLKSIKDSTQDVITENINEIIEKTSLASLLKIWNILNKSNFELNNSLNQKNSFEILLVKLCHASELPDFNKLISQLQKEVEKPNISQETATPEAAVQESAPQEVIIQEQPVPQEAPITQNAVNTENKDDIIANITDVFEDAKLSS